VSLDKNVIARLCVAQKFSLLVSRT